VANFAAHHSNRHPRTCDVRSAVVVTERVSWLESEYACGACVNAAARVCCLSACCLGFAFWMEGLRSTVQNRSLTWMLVDTSVTRQRRN
jgi:hypothetical protein